MSKAFEILSGALDEAICDAQNEKPALRRRKASISISPVGEFSADEIKSIRRSAGVPQSLFAKFFGVSTKTVEAWEAGRNKPSGPSSRLLGLLKANKLALTE
ncbi:MAG: transcriptional regulator [Schwartzia sp.]|nr:transcriptional regulator [Schwartzia sp. (in: firmicutes)]